MPLLIKGHVRQVIKKQNDSDAGNEHPARLGVLGEKLQVPDPRLARIGQFHYQKHLLDQYGLDWKESYEEDEALDRAGGEHLVLLAEEESELPVYFPKIAARV